MVVRLAIFSVGLALAAGAACVTAPAAGSPAAPVAAGVSVYGAQLGGFRSETARALVRDALAVPVELRLGKRRFRVAPEAMAVRADVDAAVTEALSAATGEAVRLRVSFDRKAVERYARRLASKLARPARDAQLLGLDPQLRPRFSAAATGRRIDAKALAADVRRALRTGTREPVTIRTRAVAPKVTARSYGPVIVIRRESNRLFYYEGRRLVRSFWVATGEARYPTPLGQFEVVDKQYHPWWYPPASDWARGLEPIPPGPGNPLGTRWMGLNVYGVGIHGTPDVASLGYSASHGCIRMAIPEVEWLFERIPHGTQVFIVPA